MQNSEKAIWLEVAQVRLHVSEASKKTPKQAPKQQATLEVRFAADRGDIHQPWWAVQPTSEAQATYRLLLDALDRKRSVLGELAIVSGKLTCRAFRIGSFDRTG